MAVPAVLALLLAGLWRRAAAEAGTEAGKCDFVNEPVFPGYYWDAACKMGMLGCNADGKNVECRYCGGGNYTNPCPPSSCHFPNDPFMPYYWEPDCKMGELGCWADGVHPQCRFCGAHPFTSIKCPEVRTAPPNGAACDFKEEPKMPHFWDPSCENGKFGCLADGINVQCRFCGEGEFKDIPCPASTVCTFGAQPTVPYYWEPECHIGMLGCNADGVHPECRYCAKRPFESIACPGDEKPKEGVCTFPLHAEPGTAHYWDPSCKEGMLGCWADGIHAECRFCGSGVFTNVTCPKGVTPATGTAAPAPASAAAAEGEQTAGAQQSGGVAGAAPAETGSFRDAPADPDSVAKDTGSSSDTTAAPQAETILSGAMGGRPCLGSALGWIALATTAALLRLA